MKFYEEVNPLDRELMLLKAVRFSTALEREKVAANKLIDEIRRLEQKNANYPSGITRSKNRISAAKSACAHAARIAA